MRIKKLLVQFEYDPSATRWLSDHGDIKPFVKTLMESVATCHTSGTIPAVTVIEEEQPEFATHHADHA